MFIALYCTDAAAVVQQSKHVIMKKSLKVQYASLPPPQPSTALGKDTPSMTSTIDTISADLPPLLNNDDIDSLSHHDTVTEEPPVRFERNRLIVKDIPHKLTEDVLQVFFENQLDNVVEEVPFSIDMRPSYTLITFESDYSDDGM